MGKDIYLVLYKKTIIGIFFEKRLALDFMDSIYQNVNYDNEYLEWEKVCNGFKSDNSLFGTLYYGGFEI